MGQPFGCPPVSPVESLLGVADRRARPTAIRLWICIARLTYGGHAGCVVAKIKAVVECRQKDAGAGMHLMITIGLGIAVHVILGHVTHPALCSIGQVPKPRGSWLWRCTCRYPARGWP